MPAMGRRLRSRTWSDSKEQAWESAATSLCPPSPGEKRTPGGQAMLKRNRRERTSEDVKGLVASKLFNKLFEVSSEPEQDREVSPKSSSFSAMAKKATDTSDAVTEEPAREPASSSTVYDVVANENGALELIPVGEQSQKSDRRQLSELRQDEIVAIRVFRFVEDRRDVEQPYEKELRNVNSGSLLWLLVHMLPKMHSVSGAKYGKWFTEHTVRVHPKHFSSSYHMCNEGYCGQAKTFGTSSATKSLVSGDKLSRGYFWFVSPAEDGADTSCQEHLESKGWQHMQTSGVLDGEDFLAEWRKQGSPMGEEALQKVLDVVLSA